jgi:glycosyltransferase involved in cell wall biosynthesis
MNEVRQEIKLKPNVTVVIPCRNEERFIGKVLDNVLEQDYPSTALEVFVVDGESVDRTASIIRRYADEHTHIKYLNNPDKIVPHGLNAAIRKASGDIVLRMDAHSEYPEDYITELVHGLDRFQCDNTGGVWITEPGNKSLHARAIADAMAHPFGVGNAQYRLVTMEPKKVDTVPYGCYRKEVFDRIGLFDEDLVRNQDDELNARLIRSGGSIYLLPHVKIRYFARENLRKTARMFYQYGLYKPLVNKKAGAPATLRQFIPPLLVLFFMVFIPLSFLDPLFFYGLLAGTLFYVLGTGIASMHILVSKKRKIQMFFHLLITFPVFHFSYGWGYLKGIFWFFLSGQNQQQKTFEPNR